MFQKIAKHRANDASNDVHRPPLRSGQATGNKRRFVRFLGLKRSLAPYWTGWPPRSSSFWHIYVLISSRNLTHHAVWPMNVTDHGHSMKWVFICMKHGGTQSLIPSITHSTTQKSCWPKSHGHNLQDIVFKSHHHHGFIYIISSNGCFRKHSLLL